MPMRRTLFLFAASCFTLTACSETTTAPEQASSEFAGRRAFAILTNDVQRDVPAALINPCNGEQILGTARIHFLLSTNDTKSGNTMTNLSTTLDFDGIGEVTGTSYNGKTREAFKYSLGTDRATEFSFDSEMRIISQGSAQNFSTTARVHVTFNANGTPTAESELVKSACNS